MNHWMAPFRSKWKHKLYMIGYDGGAVNLEEIKEEFGMKDQNTLYEVLNKNIYF